MPYERRGRAIGVTELAWSGGWLVGVPSAGPISSVRLIGRVLFRDYQFAFEATSVLILVALVGGVYLAHREDGQ